MSNQRSVSRCRQQLERNLVDGARVEPVTLGGVDERRRGLRHGAGCRLRPHPAAGHRRRAERPRRHDAQQDAIADVVEQLKRHDFYRPAHELVYDAVLDLYGRGEPADAVTVAAELTKRGEISRIGGAPYLHTLISIGPDGGERGLHYACIVRERAVLRRLVEAGTRIVQLGYATGRRRRRRACQHRPGRGLRGHRSSGRARTTSRSPDIINGTMEEIEAAGRRGEGMIGVPTGFIELDKLTNGLHPGQMIVLAARPALGQGSRARHPARDPHWVDHHGRGAGRGRADRSRWVRHPVVAATDVMVDRPRYQVTFDEARSSSPMAQHEWLTDTRASRKSRQAAAVGTTVIGASTFPAVRTTEEIAVPSAAPTADSRLNHSVTTTAPPVASRCRAARSIPYALGVWLGDGHAASAGSRPWIPEIAMRIEGQRLPPRGARARRIIHGFSGWQSEARSSARECVVCGAAFTSARDSQVRTCGRRVEGAREGAGRYTPSPSCPDCGGPSSGLRRCAAVPDRARDCPSGSPAVDRRAGRQAHPGGIPPGEPVQRRALLAGLLDPDGTVPRAAAIQFTVTDERLALGHPGSRPQPGVPHRLVDACRRGQQAGSAATASVTSPSRRDDEVFRAHAQAARAQGARRPSTLAEVTSRFITAVERDREGPRALRRDRSPDATCTSRSRSMIPTHNSTLGTRHRPIGVDQARAWRR